MSVLSTGAFWVATAERCLRSAAGGALTVISTNGINITSADWQQALAISAGAALYSLLMAIVSSTVGPNGPGLTEELPTAPVVPPAPEVAP